jgi:hypothetical protein
MYLTISSSVTTTISHLHLRQGVVALALAASRDRRRRRRVAREIVVPGVDAPRGVGRPVGLEVQAAVGFWGPMLWSLFFWRFLPILYINRR